MYQIFKSHTKKNKLYIDNRKKFDEYVEKLCKGKDIPLEMIVRIPKENCTGKQRRYYYGVVVKIGARHHGYTFKEMDEVYRAHFMDKNYDSLNDMDTKEMVEFIDNIIGLEAEQDLIIPYPNEVDIE